MRPRRLYKDNTEKYYYVINGKKTYIKVPIDVSQKKISKINIKTIVNIPSAKRVKEGKRGVPLKFQKKIVPKMEKQEYSGLPVYFYKKQFVPKTLEDIANDSNDTTVEKLSKLLLKGADIKPSSSTISGTVVKPKPTIASMLTSKLQLGTIAEESTAEKGATVVAEESTAKKGATVVEGAKRGRPKGSAGEIGVKELAKLMYAELGVTGNLATYEEAEDLIPSKYVLTRERYNQAYEETGIQALKTPEGEQSTSFYNKLKKRAGFPDTPTARVTPVGESKKSKEDTGGIGLMSGVGYDGDGLYNTEIESVLKKRIKNFVPVIASDETNQLPKYVSRGDKRFAFVINTNPSTSDGSGEDGERPGHWRAVFINNEDDYPSIDYFDPLAEGKMPEDLIKMCRQIAVKMNPSMMFKYKQNMLRRQSKMTSNCGWHCLQFLDDRYHGVPFSEASGYDDYMESLNSTPDASRDGEKEVANYIKKYESYI